MEWAVCTASCDSEDEIDQEASAKVAAESSTGHSQASIDLVFVNKAASANNGLASRDSVKAEARKKSPHKDVRDLTEFGEKDGHKVPVPQGTRPPLTVNASQKDGVSYSASKHHKIATMSDEEEELFAQEVLEEPAEEHHSPAAELRVSQKQNPGRSEVQRRKRSLVEDGQGPASKLVKKSGPPQKNQMPRGEGSSDPTRCQQSGSIPARHLEENNAAKQSINCTESKESFSPSHEVHTRKMTYTCSECKTTFKDSLSLNQHVITANHARRRHMCPECKKSFRSVDGMGEHRRTSHKVEKPFKCSECSLIFSNLANINKHRLETQHGAEIVKCPDCDKTFLNRLGLRTHQMATHKKEKKKTFQCPKCELNFRNLFHLARHNFLIHQKCLDCNMFFTSEYIAKKHWMINNTVAKRFKCTEGTKTVNTSSELVGQQEMRTGKANKTSKRTEGTKTVTSPELVGQQEMRTGKPNKTFKSTEGTTTVTSSGLVGQQEILTGKPNKTFKSTEATKTVTSSSELVGQQEMRTGKPNKTFKRTEGTKTITTSS